MKLKLVDSTDPILYAKCKDIIDIDKEVKPYVMPMLQILNDSPGGVGLAFPQVGLNGRCFIYRRATFFQFAINSQIVNHGKDMIDSEEGCLSFPVELYTSSVSK